jgi:hypothetical protein
MLLTPGFIVCAAFFILLLKLRRDAFRKLLGFDLYLDILATIIMMYMFQGTYAGMMAALVGGLAFSILLIIAKKLIGYKKLVYVNDSNHVIPTLRWIEVKPIWRRNDPELDEFLNEMEKEQ